MGVSVHPLFLLLTKDDVQMFDKQQIEEYTPTEGDWLEYMEWVDFVEGAYKEVLQLGFPSVTETPDYEA